VGVESPALIVAHKRSVTALAVGIAGVSGAAGIGFHAMG
jgi:hypothetical protein